MARPRLFQIPAILEGVSPLKDGGMSLRFHTNEIKDPRQKTKLMNFYNTFGWLQFSDKSIHSVPSESPRREAGAKTPSQRLRATLFVYWQQNHSDEPFDPWYEKVMEQLINRYKEKLR